MTPQQEKEALTKLFQALLIASPDELLVIWGKTAWLTCARESRPVKDGQGEQFVLRSYIPEEGQERPWEELTLQAEIQSTSLDKLIEQAAPRKEFAMMFVSAYWWWGKEMKRTLDEAMGRGSSSE